MPHPGVSGAILFRHGSPLQWLAQDWTESDTQIMHATLGDPAWQAEWELLALLRAVDTWIVHLRDENTALFQMDAAAALHAAARGAGRTPIMNAIAAEIAIRLESVGAGLWPEHLSGTLNFECDALSRLTQGATIPTALTGVQRVSPRPLSHEFFLAWPGSLVKTLPSQPLKRARAPLAGGEI